MSQSFAPGETLADISAPAESAFGTSCQTSVPSTVPISEPSPPITIIAMKPIANSSVNVSALIEPRYQP